MTMRYARRSLVVLLLMAASCANDKSGVSVFVTGTGLGNVSSVVLTVHGPDGKSEALGYPVPGMFPTRPLITITFAQLGNGMVSVDASALDAAGQVLASGT